MENEKNINIICTQTNYDYKTAKEKLELFENNVEKVINDYLGISNKNINNTKTSINQKIYQEIRNLMDESIKSSNKNLDDNK
jgi:hypothetical protein